MFAHRFAIVCEHPFVHFFCTLAPHTPLLRRLLLVVSSATALSVPAGGCGDGDASSPTASTVPKGTAETPSGYPVCTTAGSSTCCINVLCDLPAADGTCPAANERGSTPVCPCGEPSGPYAPGEAQADDSAAGRTCCYLVGSVACEGRPLLVAGVPVVAVLERASTPWSLARDSIATAASAPTI